MKEPFTAKAIKTSLAITGAINKVLGAAGTYVCETVSEIAFPKTKFIESNDSECYNDSKHTVTWMTEFFKKNYEVIGHVKTKKEPPVFEVERSTMAKLLSTRVILLNGNYHANRVFKSGGVLLMKSVRYYYYEKGHEPYGTIIPVYQDTDDFGKVLKYLEDIDRVSFTKTYQITAYRGYYYCNVNGYISIVHSNGSTIEVYLFKLLNEKIKLFLNSVINATNARDLDADVVKNAILTITSSKYENYELDGTVECALYQIADSCPKPDEVFQ